MSVEEIDDPKQPELLDPASSRDYELSKISHKTPFDVAEFSLPVSSHLYQRRKYAAVTLGMVGKRLRYADLVATTVWGSTCSTLTMDRPLVISIVRCLGSVPILVLMV